MYIVKENVFGGNFLGRKQMDLSKRRMLFLAAFIGVLGLLVPLASAAWIPLTGDPVSLESLNGTITVGDKIFSEIDLIGVSEGGALPPNEASVLVQGGQDSVTGDYGLRFVLSWNAFSGQTIDANLEFKVAIDPDPQYEDFYIKDVTMILINAAATGSGGVIANETVLDTPVGPGQNPPLASLSVSKQANDGGVNLLDAAEFALVKEIWVYKDIAVTGGLDGAASLSGFYQYFSQIPEPATIGLLGLGSLVLFARRKRT